MPLNTIRYYDHAFCIARRISVYRILATYLCASAVSPIAAAFVLWSVQSDVCPPPHAALKCALPPRCADNIQQPSTPLRRPPPAPNTTPRTMPAARAPVVKENTAIRIPTVNTLTGDVSRWAREFHEAASAQYVSDGHTESDQLAESMAVQSILVHLQEGSVKDDVREMFSKPTEALVPRPQPDGTVNMVALDDATLQIVLDAIVHLANKEISPDAVEARLQTMIELWDHVSHTMKKHHRLFTRLAAMSGLDTDSCQMRKHFLDSLPHRLSGCRYSIRDEVQKVWMESKYKSLDELMKKAEQVYDNATIKKSSALDALFEDYDTPAPASKTKTKRDTAAIVLEDTKPPAEPPLTRQEVQTMISQQAATTDAKITTVSTEVKQVESKVDAMGDKLTEISRTQNETARLLKGLSDRQDRIEIAPPPTTSPPFSPNRRGNERAKGGGKGRFQGTCWNCGIRGHRAADCRKPPQQQMKEYAALVSEGTINFADDAEAIEQLGANWNAAAYHEAAVQESEPRSWWARRQQQSTGRTIRSADSVNSQTSLVDDTSLHKAKTDMPSQKVITMTSHEPDTAQCEQHQHNNDMATGNTALTRAPLKLIAQPDTHWHDSRNSNSDNANNKPKIINGDSSASYPVFKPQRCSSVPTATMLCVIFCTVLTSVLAMILYTNGITGTETALLRQTQATHHSYGQEVRAKGWSPTERVDGNGAHPRPGAATGSETCGGADAMCAAHGPLLETGVGEKSHLHTSPEVRRGNYGKPLPNLSHEPPVISSSCSDYMAPIVLLLTMTYFSYRPTVFHSSLLRLFLIFSCAVMWSIDAYLVLLSTLACAVGMVLIVHAAKMAPQTLTIACILWKAIMCCIRPMVYLVQSVLRIAPIVFVTILSGIVVTAATGAVYKLSTAPPTAPPLEVTVVTATIIVAGILIHYCRKQETSETDHLYTVAAAKHRRFHSCMVRIQFKGDTEPIMAAIADTGAGHSYAPASILRFLGFKTKACTPLNCGTADGSSMQGGNCNADASFTFPDSDQAGLTEYRDCFYGMGDKAPIIIGNAFWCANHAVFDLPERCIRLLTPSGEIKETIPFVCHTDTVAAIPEHTSDSTEQTHSTSFHAGDDVTVKLRKGMKECATIVKLPTPTDDHPVTRRSTCTIRAADGTIHHARMGKLAHPKQSLKTGVPVRAAQDYVLQPGDGCVIQPYVDTPTQFVHSTTQLVLEPVITNTRTSWEQATQAEADQYYDDQMCPFHHVRHHKSPATSNPEAYGATVHCTPRACVIPQLHADTLHTVVTTTLINLGTNELIVRQGDIIAHAYAAADYTDEQLPKVNAEITTKPMAQLKSEPPSKPLNPRTRRSKHSSQLVRTAISVITTVLAAALLLNSFTPVAACPVVAGAVSSALGFSAYDHTPCLHGFVAAAPLTSAPIATNTTDGLPDNDSRFEVPGSVSISKVDTTTEDFQAWYSKHKQHIHIGCESMRDPIVKLLYCYRDVFANNNSAPEAVYNVEHAIHLIGDHVVPRKEILRRCAPRELQAMYEETEKMLRNGIIKPSTSPWAAQVIMVPKPQDPEKGLRYCVDYRYLNSVSITDSMVLPRVDDLLDSLSNAEIMSMMDMAAGFWACRIKPEHTYLTAFNTWTHGQCEFVRMPFGLKNSPATYQRLMQNTLHPYLHDYSIATAIKEDQPQSQVHDKADWGPLWRKIASLYLDDVCIHGKRDTHIDDVARILKRLRGNNISVKLVKCKFAVTEGKFLGFVVKAKRGVAVDESKVAAIVGMTRPEKVSDLKTFLGATSYMRRFIPDYSDITEPLRELAISYAHKQAPILDHEWTDEHERCFVVLKAALCTAPTLGFPDFSKEWIILCDASTSQLGACLCQLDEHGIERPVCYASRTLTAAERKYAISDLEGAAVVWSVRMWRHYLYGSKVLVVTDHSSLTTLLNKPHLRSKRQERYALDLMEYDLNIVHRPGRLNEIADMLSRACIEYDADQLKVELSKLTDLHAERLRDIDDTNLDPSGELYKWKHILSDARSIATQAKNYNLKLDAHDTTPTQHHR